MMNVGVAFSVPEIFKKKKQKKKWNQMRKKMVKNENEKKIK